MESSVTCCYNTRSSTVTRINDLWWTAVLKIWMLLQRSSVMTKGQTIHLVPPKSNQFGSTFLTNMNKFPQSPPERSCSQEYNGHEDRVAYEQHVPTKSLNFFLECKWMFGSNLNFLQDVPEISGLQECDGWTENQKTYFNYMLYHVNTTKTCMAPVDIAPTFITYKLWKTLA